MSKRKIIYWKSLVVYGLFIILARGCEVLQDAHHQLYLEYQEELRNENI